MADHQPTDRRQQQIVSAMLDLLAERPVEAITTRQIAEAVGLTQPALFRHFRSRDEILQAVLTQTRGQIGALAQGVLSQPGGALQRLGALTQGILQHVEQHPGLPRLLFRDVALDEAALTHRPIESLNATLRALVAELVRAGQREGSVRADVDAAVAARLLVALVQGSVLQWQLLNRSHTLGAEAETLLRFWLAGLAAGEPRAQAQVPPPAPPLPALHVLDVRPILQGGVDPLDAILAALARLPADGMLKIHAPFRPAPLLVLLAGKGLRSEARLAQPGVWEVEVLAQDAPQPVDLRDFEAPLPLEQVLLATARLAPGAAQLFRVPRVPNLLLPHLQERGLDHVIVEELDGSALLHVRRPP